MYVIYYQACGSSAYVWMIQVAKLKLLAEKNEHFTQN